MVYECDAPVQRCSHNLALQLHGYCSDSAYVPTTHSHINN